MKIHDLGQGSIVSSSVLRRLIGMLRIQNVGKGVAGPFLNVLNIRLFFAAGGLRQLFLDFGIFQNVGKNFFLNIFFNASTVELSVPVLL